MCVFAYIYDEGNMPKYFKCIFTFEYLNIYIYIYIYICVCVCVCICMSVYILIFNVYVYGCSVVGKSLCYHTSDRIRFPLDLHTTRSPGRCQANSGIQPSEVGKWVPDNTGAKSGSSTMRVAPIDHHWWYDLRLSSYDPGSVGRTMSTKLTESQFRCA